MDPYEATKIVFSRIQSLDPENASKIMGLLLIQDHGEKEMIRLAFGPENLFHSVVVKARQELGLNPKYSASSNTSRFLSNGVKIPTSLSIPPLSSPSSVSSPSWGASIFSDIHNPDELISPNSSNGGIWSSTSSSAMNCGGGRGVGGDFMDEIQLQEQLSFLNDGSPALRSKDPDLYYPGHEMGSGLPHRRSCSVSDMNLGSFDDPLGWRSCLYYARGFCKNGATCRFIHGGGSDLDPATLIGSPTKLDMFEHSHELFRSKSMLQHKLISDLGSPSSFPYNKGLNFLAQQQQNDSPRAVSGLSMGEEMHKFGRSRLDNGRPDLHPASRQIYLTFPADSTFREEDVSNYFSIYGPVQDVRIPYQQKRMFGFVTFLYPETVKMILAKGNPHFVCDSRVLVKPYKEKGKVPDKYRKQQHQQMDNRGEFSACNSPTSLDSRDPFDLQLGGRMMYDTQYMLWRRKLEEQADLQQALELQSRRLMGLQLLDVKRNHHHRSLSAGGATIPSPTLSPNSFFNQPLLASDRSSPDAPEENCSSLPISDTKLALQLAANGDLEKEKEGSNGKESPHCEDNSLPESLEHNLPDSPFASPTKGECLNAFFSNGAANEAENTSAMSAFSAQNGSKASPLLAENSPIDLAPLKSCYFQMPRFSSGHGAIGM